MKEYLKQKMLRKKNIRKKIFLKLRKKYILDDKSHD